MSKRETKITNDLAVLNDYAAAEARLLDLFSPLSSTVSEEPNNVSGAAALAATVAAAPSAVEQQAEPEQPAAEEMDPATDNMLHYISDNSDIRSLLSTSDKTGFKGFDDNWLENGEANCEANSVASPQVANGGLIFGMFRNVDNNDLNNYLSCTGLRGDRLQAVAHEPEPRTGLRYVYANGNEDPMVEQHMLLQQADNDCVIYEQNVVLLTEDQCCGILVSAHDNMGSTNYMQLVEQEQQQSQMGATHVYLSDAALANEQSNEQQQLLIDAAEEQAADDDYEEQQQRPDICEVYEHEMEEQDDECVAGPLEHDSLPLQEQEEEDEMEPQQQARPPRSSTTEFPVSSTSMPNASDYDDFDDELEDSAEQHLTVPPPPPRRRYGGLLKNTLAADAMGRQLASICKSQPPLSLNEKVANWNCSRSCEAVEDVENFAAIFERHEAGEITTEHPTKHQDFSQFYEEMQKSLSKISLSIRQRAGSNVLRQQEPSTAVDEPIVLDDDDEDEDDDCMLVPMTPSSATLRPQPNEEQQTASSPAVAVETETQTPTLSMLETKETSTTDLVSSEPAIPGTQATQTPQYEFNPLVSLDEPDEGSMTLMEQQQDMMRSNDDMFYQQHEFCNYLGLTELATANAVAIAMRELAKSTMARRSLRVRTQEQLNRMRSGVRGQRRERREQPQEQTQEQGDGEQLAEQAAQQSEQLQTEHQRQQLMFGSSSSSGSSLSEQQTLQDVAAPVNSDNLVFHMPPDSSKQNSQHVLNYFYQAQQQQQQQQQQLQPGETASTTASAKELHAKTLEAAFAKVYAAAAPAQTDLHENIQTKLRKARETKPAIYIVQAMSNSAPSSSQQAPTSTSPSTARHSKTPEKQTPQQSKAAGKSTVKLQSKKSTPKTVPKATTQRRRTTAAVGVTAVQSSRELVQRSTRHMHTKLLRNRKVNMLKTYELSDVARATGTGNNKQRLSGGGTSKANKTTPKLRKPIELLEQQPSIVPPPQQYRVDQQQRAQAKPRKLRMGGGAATAARADKRQLDQMEQELEQRVNICKRLRGMSLPMPGKSNLSEEPPLDVPNPIAIVSPPPSNDIVQHFVQKLRKSQEPPVSYTPTPAQLTSETFYNLKPALIYPPPAVASPTHFSRRPRQASELATHNIHLTPPGGLLSLNQGSAMLPNPLAGKFGKVLYLYYELEQLIAVQEKLISFWKYAKVFTVLQRPQASTEDAKSSNLPPSPSKMSDNSSDAETQRWVYLGGNRRLTHDLEVQAPYGNRICVHNSTPIYVEMRSHPLDHHKRESKLLSLYLNVYYYCEEEMRPKMHSVHLDSVNCDSNQVIYTSIAESRYFVMSWQQELGLGKPRSGLCKYSLTPTLDTLASIREFKHLRHELKHIECLTEDRLIGYGSSRLTIWDHRSGDTLMNYDLGFQLGRNLGVMHFPSFDMEQSSMLILYQHVREYKKSPELRIIACELTEATPTHRVLYVHRLPAPQFDTELMAINTGDHLILKSASEDEIWVSTSDPRQLTYLAPQGTQRYYTRQKSQVIEYSPQTLNVDSIANYMLKLATQQQKMMLMAANEVMGALGSSQSPLDNTV
ncbi:CG16972 [Drosophila busckii]|uniref:CG16972 n=1 Tax=Drosophila busckii TaxID=30019 RepID=A0A0M4E7K3_DROBS|nr:uncharacterized protein LOC108608225 [Drosophila busckii]ALC38765.1 CG16972 [Drosophila busckii]